MKFSLSTPLSSSPRCISWKENDDDGWFEISYFFHAQKWFLLATNGYTMLNEDSVLPENWHFI